MTDRVATLTVVLDRDMRTDDVKDLIKLLHAIRYVADVKQGPALKPADYEHRARVASALRDKVLAEVQTTSERFGGLESQHLFASLRGRLADLFDPARPL